MTHYIQHNNRSLLKISGDDKEKFLQGLITNDIKYLESQDIIFSAMLNGSGKFLYDFFIFKNKENFIIDIPFKFFNDFKSKLLMYKLRSDVQIAEIADICVFQIFGFNENIDLSDNNIFAFFKDPRNDILGHRIYLKDNEFLKRNNISSRPFEFYKSFLITNKIVEGEDLIQDKSIILEYGYKEQNSISFDKGCYLGQELMTRTERLGQIRKKLSVLTFDDKLNNDQKDELINNKIKIICEIKFENKFYFLVISKLNESEIKNLILDN